MVVVTKCNLSVELLRILLMVSIIIYHILYSVIVPGLSNRFFCLCRCFQLVRDFPIGFVGCGFILFC